MDDNNLITLLQQGDQDAYKQLFIKYYSPLCEYASQYISDDDSEELVQELMLFLWETRENLVIETSLKSYLFISTKHRCLNAIRKNLYHERIHTQIYEKIKDQFEDPDYYFVNELTENIQKAIEKPARNLSGNICYEPIRGKYECANCPKTRSIGKNRRIQDIAGT